MATAVKAVHSAMCIFEVLDREQKLSMTKLSQLLDLPQSSIREILCTLNNDGFESVKLAAKISEIYRRLRFREN
jgi:DNA-binding IclR family transcriptional regulator